MEFHDAKHFQILYTLLGIVWNHLITPITRMHHRNIFCQKIFVRNPSQDTLNNLLGNLILIK